jgi:purine-cytosine permease-like protein
MISRTWLRLLCHTNEEKMLTYGSAVGMLGPLAYDLGFTDSALCAAFGAVLGAAGAAYMSTFGPESGNRTMVSSTCNSK